MCFSVKTKALKPFSFLKNTLFKSEVVNIVMVIKNMEYL